MILSRRSFLKMSAGAAVVLTAPFGFALAKSFNPSHKYGQHFVISSDVYYSKTARKAVTDKIVRSAKQFLPAGTKFEVSIRPPGGIEDPFDEVAVIAWKYTPEL